MGPLQLLIRPACLGVTDPIYRPVCLAPLWLSCSPRSHGQNFERQHFAHGPGLDGPGHQCFRLRASALETEIGV